MPRKAGFTKPPARKPRARKPKPLPRAEELIKPIAVTAPAERPRAKEEVNKYIWIAALGSVALAGGLIYRVFFLAPESAPVVTGKVREITVVAKKDYWGFIPEEIEVERGDKIILTVINEDGYDHGIAIDAFGISQRMPAEGTIQIEFIATQAGDFPFYCSVPCGEGVVDGEKRGHFDMIGKIKVRDIIRGD